MDIIINIVVVKTDRGNSSFAADVNKLQTWHFCDDLICYLPGMSNNTYISNYKLVLLDLFISVSLRTSFYFVYIGATK